MGKRIGNYDTLALIHGPSQLLLSGESMRKIFPQRKTNDTYNMRFDIKTVERIRRRNKKYHPCLENWNSYDSEVLEEHIKSTGCRAPYQNRIENVPACSTQQQIKKSMFILRNDGYQKDPPCQGMKELIMSMPRVS